MNEAPAQSLLSIRKLSKTFPGTVALDSVDLDLARGEVLGLVGQNGSGKSTLIKILAGFHEPDPGSEVLVAGEPLTFGGASAARRAGLRFVHQDLALVLDASIVENLALGRGYATRFGGRIDWGAERRDAERRLEELGYQLDARRPVRELAAAERTGVAIARALDHWEDARVLVVDEPTASLPADEVRILLSAIDRVRAGGLGVIYVSHRLDEVLTISNRLAVLRDGRLVATLESRGATEQDVIGPMVGAEKLRVSVEGEARVEGDDLLEVSSIGGAVVDDATFTARAGEVLGISGLRGSGREEMLSLIFGALPRIGDVRIGGQLLPPSNPRKAVAAGLALVPSDRLGEGSVAAMTVQENCTLTDLVSHSTRIGALRLRGERKEVESWIAELDIRPPVAGAPFASLSGGNQQKVVLAKWLRRNPKVLLLDEPTQGVDVHAKATIHVLVRQAAERGSAVVVASSDDNELCDICDRVLIVREGVVADQVTSGDLTPHRLAALQLGEAVHHAAS